MAAIALVGFCNDIQLPGAWTACMDVGGKSVATLSGTMNMMGNVGGFVSPIVCGYIVKQTGNWNLAFYVTAARLSAGRLLLAGHGPGHAAGGTGQAAGHERRDSLSLTETAGLRRS